MESPDPQNVRRLLDATVQLVSVWSRVETQHRIAHDIGVTLPDADTRAIYTLGLSGCPLTPSELADRLGYSRPATSKLLSRLTSGDFITRETRGADRRSSAVTLTPRGSELFEELVAAGERLMRDAVHDLHGKEIADVTRVLTQLTERFTSTPTP